MIQHLPERAKYCKPLIECGELAPEILCESPDAGLEAPETGDPWTF